MSTHESQPDTSSTETLRVTLDHPEFSVHYLHGQPDGRALLENPTTGDITIHDGFWTGLETLISHGWEVRDCSNGVEKNICAQIQADNDLDFAFFDFDHGDTVKVDWSEGMGPYDLVRGVVTGISVSAGDIIVTVTDFDQPAWPDGRKYDAAPEWVTPMESGEESGSRRSA